MRRSLIWFPLLCLLAAAISADAATGRVIKVLPHFLDLQGRHVRTLAETALPAGPGSATWDLNDERGGRVPPGLYWVRLDTGAGRRTARVVVTL